MKFNNILESVGNTPLVKINRLFPEANKKNITIYAKLERANPGGSIKDRIAKRMIEDAQKKGLVKEGTVIVEPTSGNTGVGLAMACAVLGYRLIITMPESMSLERRRLMALFGAELVLTPKEKGMKGAIEKAQEICEQEANSWMPMQFDNPSNVDVHRDTTAKEILADIDGSIDYLITGVGTGGHITGVSEVLKEKFNNLKVVAVEPADSPVLSGGEPGPHPIQGIGAGFVPSVLNRELLDEVVTISKDEAFEFARSAARLEGILLGISSGASLAAIEKKISEMPEGSTVLTFCYDTGERYLSTEGLF
ncbi:cysteine synthase A [Halobacteriovorax sp. XZX-3]|uniref:cysteine synthase A n=1 Tax=unclassified Halobacteriovorax TaxID=2639665 RepID=UPI000CD292C8|nr:cysteine synthase A [Halobacteriovorax sp. DA5]POB14036.1 cysteine synthase A [Halobacteriovorax sp. DA5]